MRPLSLLTLTIALIAPQAHAQKPVTPDFIANEAEKMFPARWMVWIKDHDLLLGDDASKNGGVIDLDAATGTKRHIGDTTTLASLKAAGGPALKRLDNPDVVDQTGKYLGYAYTQGFFLLDISSNKFQRVSSIPPNSEEIHFSPDASYLSYVSGHDLFAVPTPDGESKRLTTTGKPNFLNATLTWVYWEEIYNHDTTASWWSPDSRQIAFLETDESPVPLTTYVDFRPQYAATKTQCYPKPGNANPNVRLKVIDVATGDTKAVPLVENQEYIVGVKWGAPGKLLLETFNRAQTQARYSMFEPDSGKLTPLATDNEKWLDVNTDFDLIDGGSSFLYASAKTGFNHYYKVPVAGGNPIPITKGLWEIESNVEGPTAAQLVDKKKGRILFTCTKDSFLERQVYTVKTDGSGLRRITKGRGYHYVLASNDGDYFTDEYSNIDTPAVTRLFRTPLSLRGTSRGRGQGVGVPSGSGSPSTDGMIVDAAHPELLNAIFHNKEKFLSIAARDGFQLPAKISMPRKMVAGKRYPVIMHIYGGPESPMVMDRWSFFWAIDQLLSDAGYVVLSVDCRSATVKGRKYQEEARGHYYGAPEHNDFIDAARWVKNQPYADPGRVGIWGWSGGGGNTLNCMCHSTEFKAGIAGAPYVDPSLYDTFYSEHLYGLPKDNPQGYKEAAVWQYAKNLHGKLLLIWGSGDDNVQPQHELTFIDACIAAGKPIQLMLYPMRKHGFGDAAATKHLYQTCLDFWKGNL